jgi:uncharacterized membrane protein
MKKIAFIIASVAVAIGISYNVYLMSLCTDSYQGHYSFEVKPDTTKTDSIK